MGINWFDFIKEILPDAMDLVQYLINLKDEEFVEISVAWPAPIKSNVAKMRAVAAARKHYLKE